MAHCIIQPSNLTHKCLTIEVTKEETEDTLPKYCHHCTDLGLLPAHTGHPAHTDQAGVLLVIQKVLSSNLARIIGHFDGTSHDKKKSSPCNRP
jgi:hypothetical protein